MLFLVLSNLSLERSHTVMLLLPKTDAINLYCSGTKAKYNLITMKWAINSIGLKRLVLTPTLIISSPVICHIQYSSSVDWLIWMRWCDDFTQVCLSEQLLLLVKLLTLTRVSVVCCASLSYLAHLSFLKISDFIPYKTEACTPSEIQLWLGSEKVSWFFRKINSNLLKTTFTCDFTHRMEEEYNYNCVTWSIFSESFHRARVTSPSGNKKAEYVEFLSSTKAEHDKSTIAVAGEDLALFVCGQDICQVQCPVSAVGPGDSS